MNMFKKKQKNEPSPNWRKSSGSFIMKPTKGWIHPDHHIETSSVAYKTQYAGYVKVLESVKTIPFEQRGLLVREAISRCYLASKSTDFKKKNKCEDATINDRLGDICLDHSGASTSTTFSKSFIKTYILNTGENILDHSIQCISFASIGENEYKSFIGYIAKDKIVERACFVFDCGSGIADDIILTIGQAFELKYKEYLNCNSKIQPVVKRFTDVDEGSDNVPSSNNSYVASNRDEPGYAELFSGDNTSVCTVTNAPGYDSLQRNDNTNNYDATFPDSNMNFSPCALYDGKEAEFGAIYDNPISAASVDMKNTSIRSLDNNDVPDGDEEYLEPLPSSIIEEHASSHLDLNSDSNSNTNDVLSNIITENWFHGKISREVAGELIKHDGDFLVRESTSSKGQFVLSGMRDGLHRHILMIDPEGKVQTKDHVFKDVPELIRYHVSQEIPISSGSSEVFLIREIPKLSL